MAKVAKDILTSVRNNNNWIQPNTSWGGYDILPDFSTIPKAQPKTKTPYEGQEGGRNTQDKDYYDLATKGAVGTMLNGVLGANKLGDSLKAPTGGGGGGYGYIPTYNPYARYASPYQGKIDALMDALLNRDPFSYDYLSDPVYQSYRQQYEFQGDRARENAIGDYAANTGGLASSWANTRGQLRQNNYNAQLNGLIPELENARYNRYLGEIETDLNNLGQLQNLENMNYDRFLNDRNYDLQLQQLTQSGRRSRARSSGGGSSSSKSTANDKVLRANNAYQIALDIMNGGEMPSADALTQMGVKASDVQTQLKKMGYESNEGSMFGNLGSVPEEEKKKSWLQRWAEAYGKSGAYPVY